MVDEVILKDVEERSLLLNNLDEIPTYVMKKKVFDSLIHNYKNNFDSSEQLMNDYQLFKAVQNGYFDQEAEIDYTQPKESPDRTSTSPRAESVPPDEEPVHNGFEIPMVQY